MLSETTCRSEEEEYQDRLSVSISMYTIPVIIVFAYLSSSIYSALVQIYKRISQILWDRFTVSIQVSGAIVDNNTEDTVYYKLINWFSRTYPDFPSRTATCTYNQLGSNGKETIASPPGFGTHYFKYKDHWIRLQRNPVPSARSSSSTCETMILTAWASQKHLLNDILAETMAKVEIVDVDENKVCIFRIYGEDWTQIGSAKNRRVWESVILDEGISERILEDANSFIERREWYLRRDIPHRRGYLLYGPPGCGKTSFVKAMAGQLGYNICVLSLSSKGLTDDGLTNLLENAPNKSIVLMEDIDAAFKSREDPTASTSETNLAFEGRAPNALTFRGLLNALDGVASCEDGRIICMTTNYVDKLDPALIRCGRVDQKIAIDYPTQKQLRRLFERFYEETTEELTTQFVECVRDLNQNVSVAMIQGLFLMYKDSPQDAVKYSKKYFKEEFSIGDIKSESDASSASSTGLYS